MGSEQQHEVNCKQAYDLLFAYLEGELPADAAEELTRHFALCPPCEEFLASYRKTPGLARAALSRTEVPEVVKRQLKDYLRKKLGPR